MNRMIRLMSGVLLVAAVAACNNDPSLDLSGAVGAPTKVQATPQIMFINQGATKTVYLRLTDDANFATPVGPYTVSDVGPGLTVVWDSTYRPDYIPGTLTNNPIQTQHRYTVKAEQNVMTSFKVTNKGITQELTVRVIPTTLGSNLSSTAPAIGEDVTLTATPNLSFSIDPTAPSVVTVGGQTAIIRSLTATSITFTPLPGSSGEVSVTNVTTDYAPVLGKKTLTTSVSVDVPAITSVPLAFSNSSTAAGTPITVTAAGFAFDDDVQFTFGANDAAVLAVSANGSTATIVPPAGLTSQTATVSNFHLANLPDVSLSGIPSVAGVTTSASYPAAAAGGGTFGTAISMPASVSKSMGTFIGENGPLTFGPDVNYLGGSNYGGPRNYKLIVTEAGTYDIYLSWTGGGDFDLYLRTAADTDAGNSPSGANPEHVRATLTPGTYYIVMHDWQNSNPNPTSVSISVR